MFAPMTFNVTTTVDELNANAQTSLREAIQLANANPGADTINIPAGTYQLTRTGAGEDANQTGDLDITESVTLVGDAQGTTFIQAGTKSWRSGSADGIDRVFDVVGNGPVNTTFQDLTIRFGKTTGFASGGGINHTAGGDLTLTRVTVSDNQSNRYGGGVEFDSTTLTVTDSQILNNNAPFGNGGGIELSSGSGTITGSVISDNLAEENDGGGGDGGGVFAFGDLMIVQSTISNNEAKNDGGGIYTDSQSEGEFVLTVVDSTVSGNDAQFRGGGIYTRDVATTVTNSTISGNSAATGGGVYGSDYESSPLVVFLNSTITLNDAEGILLSQFGLQCQLGNTIVADNVMSDVSGDFISNGNNLIGAGDGSTGLVNNTNGDQVGTLQSPIDPLLGPLQNNGGPTFTHALLDGSPAINKGLNSLATIAGLTFDQRGTPFVRISNGTVDVGAFERQVSVTSIFVTSADDGATSKPFVKVFDTNGNVLSKFLAYESSYLGGVRVAVGDLTGDGVPEIVTAPGRGHVPLIKVFTFAGVELKKFRFLAYNANFAGGVHVAVGNVVGDGLADIVVGPSRGPALVRVFANQSFTQADPINAVATRSFLAFNANYIGGVTVATGNITGGAGSLNEVIVGSTSGAPAVVKVVDVQGTPIVTKTFRPFAASYRGGVFLSTGDFQGDGIDELIVSGNQSGASQVKVFNGATGALIRKFTSYEGKSKQSAVHIVSFDIDDDGQIDGLLTSQANDGRTFTIKYLSLNADAVDLILEDDVEFAGGSYLGFALTILPA